MNFEAPWGHGMRAALRVALAAVLLCCGRTLDAGQARTSPTLAMSSAPECTQCHLVWLDDFAQPGVEWLVPYQRDESFRSGREGAESTDLMCYSCHDGYVADSRARIRLGYQHPVLASITLLKRPKPKGVPLLREEEVYCGTCHTPHGPGPMPSAAGRATSAPAPTQTVKLEGNAFLRLAARPGPISLCDQCHEYTSTTLVGNHRVGLSDFPLPPELARQHGRSDTEKGGIGCQTCHTPHGARYPSLTLLGETDSSTAGLCAVCHKEDFSKYGLGRFSHPVGVSPMAMRGPDDRATAGPAGGNPKPKFPNGELVPLTGDGRMTCLSCHDVHDSRVPGGLLRQTPLDGSLCETCHPGLADPLQGSGHDLRVWAPEAKNIAGKTAVQSGMCSACHIPHKGRNVSLWARPDRGAGRAVDRLCLSCHSSGGPAVTVLRGPMTHDSEVNKTLIRLRAEKTDPSLAMPVYDDEGRPAERGFIACPTCHNPHQWAPDAGHLPPLPKTASTQAGHGDSLNSFLRRRSDEQICKHCHGIQSLWRYKYFHSSLRFEK